jgi:hypothetical protein
MPELRRSARNATSSSPTSSQGLAKSPNGAKVGTKRKAETTSGSIAKRGRKSSEKKQKTIEETLPDVVDEQAVKDTEMKEADATESQDVTAQDATSEVKTSHENVTDDKNAEEEVDVIKSHEMASPEAPAAEKGGDEKAENDVNGHEDSSKMDSTGKVEAQVNSKQENSEAQETSKQENGEAHETSNQEKTDSAHTNGNAVLESSQREKSTPSSILEKGLIYFFFRGRVGIDSPSDVDEIARSYIVLRPLPHGAKLGDGPLADSANNRLLALPKKVLPQSHRDRFMLFVEEAHSTIEDIKSKHLTSSDYMTKTAGARHTPAATPVAEGVYAITTTGRESHLAYILTIPSELSEVQKDVGLRERGSFVTSLKNPKYPSPAGTGLPQGAEYPEE